MAETHVKGLADLRKFLDQVPVKIERNIMRGALRAGMKTVLPVAQSRIHSVSGKLAAGLKIGTRARGKTVTSNLKATGEHRSVANLVEFGTRPHEIIAKLAGSLFLGGIFRKVVRHPGARPRPFMRPALDQQANAAVVAAGEYMKKRLATKHGLDTYHIMIEGDE